MSAGTEAQFTFEVRHGLPGEPKDQWSTVATYSDVEQAKNLMTQLKAGQLVTVMAYPLVEGWTLPEGHSVAIKKIDTQETLDLNWREREAQRFATGRYKRVPWDDYRDSETWNVLAKSPEGWASYWPRHYVHVAESDASKVAFTESHEKGQKDIQKVLTVEAYFQRYYSGNERCEGGHTRFPMCPEPTWREWEEEMSGAGVNVLFSELGNADEMQKLYERCGGTGVTPVGSCMGYSAGDSHFSSNIHPVRAYAYGGDLVFAYLEDANRHIKARALVWPDKKKVGRVYGLAASRLVRGLMALGYERPSDDYDGLEGARIARIPNLSDPEASWAEGVRGSSRRPFIMPYIDGHHRFAEHGADYFRIDEDGEFSGERTDGLAMLIRYVLCIHCEGQVEEDEADSFEGEVYCSCCVSEVSFTCDECDERCRSDERSFANIPSTITYSRSTCASVCDYCLGGNFSEFDGEYYRNDMLADCEACSETCRSHDLTELDGLNRCPSCHSDRQELRELRQPLLNELSMALDAAGNASLTFNVDLSLLESSDPEERLREVLETVSRQACQFATLRVAA